eukprot:scaffold97824_cov37-Phaeocystis_antarctica.AAC.2
MSHSYTPPPLERATCRRRTAACASSAQRSSQRCARMNRTRTCPARWSAVARWHRHGSGPSRRSKAF